MLLIIRKIVFLNDETADAIRLTSYPLTVLLIDQKIVFLKDETADAIWKNYSLYMRTIMTYSCADSFKAKDI